jgi:hypothetical protein
VPAQTDATGLNYITTKYKQCAAPWGTLPLGDGSCVVPGSADGTKASICSDGCAVTAIAMWAVKKGCSTELCNPGTLNTWLKDHGSFAGCLMRWSAVRALLRL